MRTYQHEPSPKQTTLIALEVCAYASCNNIGRLDMKEACQATVWRIILQILPGALQRSNLAWRRRQISPDPPHGVEAKPPQHIRKATNHHKHNLWIQAFRHSLQQPKNANTLGSCESSGRLINLDMACHQCEGNATQQGLLRCRGLMACGSWD